MSAHDDHHGKPREERTDAYVGIHAGQGLIVILMGRGGRGDDARRLFHGGWQGWDITPQIGSRHGGE